MDKPDRASPLKYGKTRQLNCGREKGETGKQRHSGARRNGPVTRGCQGGQDGVPGNGETSAHFNLSQGNLRQDFKEGKNPHAPPPSPLENWLELSED